MGSGELCRRNAALGVSSRIGRGGKCRGPCCHEQSNYCTTRGRASGPLRRRSAVLEKSSEVGMMAMECGARSAQ